MTEFKSAREQFPKLNMFADHRDDTSREADKALDRIDELQGMPCASRASSQMGRNCMKKFDTLMCTRRSQYYGHKLPHLYTSRIQVDDGPWIEVCSWCEHQKPAKGS